MGMIIQKLPFIFWGILTLPPDFGEGGYCIPAPFPLRSGLPPQPSVWLSGMGLSILGKPPSERQQEPLGFAAQLPCGLAS